MYLMDELKDLLSEEELKNFLTGVESIEDIEEVFWMGYNCVGCCNAPSHTQNGPGCSG